MSYDILKLATHIVLHVRVGDLEHASTLLLLLLGLLVLLDLHGRGRCSLEVLCSVGMV